MSEWYILVDRTVTPFYEHHGVPWLDKHRYIRLVFAETLDFQTHTRSSSETSCLREALVETTNLRLYKITAAKELLFDASKLAIGIRVNSDGFEYQINASKEVIVSAEAVC